jgi:hypothetical protein
MFTNCPLTLIRNISLSRYLFMQSAAGLATNTNLNHFIGQERNQMNAM